MNHRRTVPLLLVGLAIVAVACSSNSVTTDVKSVPYGFLTFTARKAGAGHVAVPTGTFYLATGLGVPTSTSPWDSCRVQPYAPATGVGLGTVFPSMNAGSSIQLKLPARTDSLFPTAVAGETQYLPRNSAAIAYTPGDSVSAVIPGASGDKGYPAISFKGKTAEAFSVQDFGTLTPGTRIDLKWTAGQDLNSTMVFSLRYTTPGATSPNSEIYCQFRDDGVDSIPGRYVGAYSVAAQKSWVASRVRTYVAAVSRNGYFDFISTYDIPTP